MTNQTMKPDILLQALAYLRELPADADVWEDDVPAFLSSLRTLTEEKSVERAAVISKKTIARAIFDFQSRQTQLLEYFEFDTSKWSPPDRIDQAETAEVAEMFETMADLFEEYVAIPGKGPSLKQTRILNDQREGLENRITDLKSELDRFLNTSSVSEDQSSEPDSGIGTDEGPPLTETNRLNSDVALVDLQVSDGSMEFDPSVTSYKIEVDNGVEILVLSPVPSADDIDIDVTARTSHDDIINVEHSGDDFRIMNIGVGETSVMVSLNSEDRPAGNAYALTVYRAASDDANLGDLSLSVGELTFEPDNTNYEVNIPFDTNDMTVKFELSHPSSQVAANISTSDGEQEVVLAKGQRSFSIPTSSDEQFVIALRVTAEDRVSQRSYTMSVSSQRFNETGHLELMWSLVAHDDLAGAYWIARSLANQSAVSPQLPTLLMAAQASRWLTPESKSFVGDLFNIVSEAETPFDDDALVMLGLAAAIRPALIAPETNLIAWLNTPNCLPSLERVVAPVREFANLGHALGPEFVRGDEWNRRLEGLIGDSSSRSREWLGDAAKRRHNLVWANNVWRQLCTDEGFLGKMHENVGNDIRDEAASVRSDVETFSDESFLDEMINDIHKTLHPNVRNEITGAARLWLHQRIGEAVNIASEWCELVQRASQSERGARNQWLSDHVADLRRQVAAACDEALDDINRLINGDSRQDLAASATCLAYSLHTLLDYLSVESDSSTVTEVPRVVVDLRNLNENTTRHGAEGFDLETAVSRRLLWLHHVELLDNGKPRDADCAIDLQRLIPDWFADEVGLDQLVKSRISAGDFRFLDVLSTGLAANQPSDPEALFPIEMTTARQTLQEHRDLTSAAINQAASDGVIEYDGNRWTELTKDLEDIVVDQTFNFKGCHDALDRIERTIERDGHSRRTELMAEWTPLIDALGNSHGVDQTIVENLDQTFRLASHEDSLDIRIMEDCVSRVRNHKSGDGQDLLPSKSVDQSQVLEDFLTFCENSVDVHSHASANHRLRNLLRRSTG